MDCISFTSTLMAVYDGDLTIDQLNKPDVHFHFGCLREHVFKEGAPYEATWRNTELPHVLDSRAVRLSEIDEDKRNTWMWFLGVLLLADREDRITWGICRGSFIGGYYEYAKELRAEGKDVFPKKYFSHLDTKTGEWVED